MPAAELLAAVGLGHVLAVGSARVRGVVDVEGRRVEARQRGLELGVEVGVPLPLQAGRSCGRCLGAFARRRVEGVVDRLIAARVRRFEGHGFLVRHGRRIHQRDACVESAPGLVSFRVAQFQGRPEARVLADGELAADAEELVLAVGVGSTW